ncbi:amidohydrolase family protein [Salmonella enterica subsp. salamae serovar 6,7:z:1,5]|nr:amidohydrolase family protein [Salmonella enterica subsp. salamae serovar 6,7:z:1,5]HCH7729734.1 amidohydrolase family protein [Salmonella enterica subsp. enterica serovar Infantis]HCH7829767.1 amidohydrolase family protein [Salmonella enterica subsp. enterica serovar Infantis]HCH7833144.1 amidohydrolase family protein [Salmonella enterica subsp. enterica serovar Infantis]HCI4928254.1 amidohydrolase family protein [Salmonella enterica subsp. enterica serovar Infantis]
MFFDTHAHVFTSGLPLAEHCRYVPEYDATPDQYLAQLEQHHIDKAILIQPSFLGTDNSYMLEAIRQSPDRFYGVAVIDPDTPLCAMETLKQQGIIGVRLNLIGQELPDLTMPVWQQHLRHINALGWHIELHRPAADLVPLLGVLLAADVKIVIDHFGLPAGKDNDPGFIYLLKYAETGKIWVKISASYRNGSAQKPTDNTEMLMPLLLTHFGSKRLLWGSDWPHTRYEDRMTYTKAMDEIHHWELTNTQLNNILSQSVIELINS